MVKSVYKRNYLNFLKKREQYFPDFFDFFSIVDVMDALDMGSFDGNSRRNCKLFNKIWFQEKNNAHFFKSKIKNLSSKF